MGEKMAFRARNPEQTRADILAAARAEFARLGLAGARVDTIAEASGANKRMIYHYFGGKDQLFEAVIEDAYAGIRAGEADLGLDEMTPADALRALVEATWQYYLAHPEFITLVNSANLHQGRHIAGNKPLRKLHKAYVERVAAILQRGEAQRKFRKGVDPVQLCLTIAAIGFDYLNNRHTGGALFGFNFMSRDALARRLQFNVDTIMRIVLV